MTVLTIEQVLARVEVKRSELERWVDQRWVLPARAAEGKGEAGYRFDDVDLARLRLIAELRRDFEVTEEAMPVILQLLDQVYSLRRALGELQDAIALLPEETRAELDEIIRESQPRD